MGEHRHGEIVWRDLTVADANSLRQFYEKVVGWKTTEHPMGEYCDYNVQLPDGSETVAGICHSRGTNANVPPQWLMYVLVADVDACAKACVESGGEVVDGPRDMGGSPFCVIRDPAGAFLALIGG